MLLSFVLLAVVVALTHCQLYGPVDDYRRDLISNNRKEKVIKYFYFFKKKSLFCIVRYLGRSPLLLLCPFNVIKKPSELVRT